MTSDYPDLKFLGDKEPGMERVSHRDFDNIEFEKRRVSNIKNLESKLQKCSALGI
jgi:hypothetical protein